VQGQAREPRLLRQSNLLPRAVALGKTVQSGDETCLEDGLFGETLAAV
jgi:hypothetical protein